MAEELQLTSWDLQCKHNTLDHRTAEGDYQKLMVRRGQSFIITLHFAGRAYDAEVDQLTFHVETGPCPIESSGTKSQFPLSCSLEETIWNAAVEGQDGNSLTVFIFSPPDARIGQYRLDMEVSSGGQGTSYYLGDFLLLFNPWCIDDSVFMESEEERMDYVLMQHGQIYQGNEHFINPIPWNFGQFEDGILDICFQLLDTNPKFLRDQDKDCSRRNTPVYVSRVVSAMVNSNDGDKGVIVGRWDNCYSDGVNPLSWNGSVDILQRWQKDGCRPVRYGQCWVFAAVACTVLRALGIPCRVVTNYESAHDTNGDLIIETKYYLSGEGVRREWIWNFHCWLEAWMTRPDLPEGYGGWQVVDPTPQEKSEGIFCCGPTPVKAIKEGDLHLKYDARFVFAEVNADMVFLIQQSDMTWRKTIFEAKVGQNITTKSVGRDTKEDITHNYKYPEGSQEERAVFKKAQHQKQPPAPLCQEGLKVRIKGSEGMNNGCDFDVFAVLNNNTPKEHRCRLILDAHTASYNGVLGPVCGSKDLLNVYLKPSEEKVIPLRILYVKYRDSMMQDNIIKVKALLMDQETNETILGLRNIYVKNPDIKIRVLGEPIQKRKMVAELTLTNPLPTPLNGCVFTMEGAGLTRGQKVHEIETPVEPGKEANVRLDFVPQQSGLRKLVVNFESDKLKGVKGYRNVIIAPLHK